MIPFEDYDDVIADSATVLKIVAYGATGVAAGVIGVVVVAGLGLRWIAQQVVRNGL